jgi:hypothetical protein
MGVQLCRFQVKQGDGLETACVALSEARVDTVEPLAYVQRNFEIDNLRLGDFQRGAAPVSPCVGPAISAV